ncbi:MAG: hypothetical protein ACTSYD_01570 [Candidatus Heimdallarchaeaceae archaeon]
MVRHFPYDMWISVGSDAGLSFASIGHLAKDSSMMQGILLSLQSLMSTEMEVSDSQFMTGETDYVKFGTFRLSENDVDVVVQYVLKSDEPNSISKTVEELVQEISLSFCKYITLTPNFVEYIEKGKMIPKDYVAKAFLNASTLAKQKVSLPSNKEALESVLKKLLKEIEQNPSMFPTLIQLQNLDQWFGNDENSWEKGMLVPFKRQLIIQMLSLDILNEIIETDPLAILEYPRPRNVIEEIQRNLISYLQEKRINANEIIIKYLGKKWKNQLHDYLHELSLNEIHSADTFISHNLSKLIITSIAKETPLLALYDFRHIHLYRTIQKEIKETIQIPTPGDIICNALIDDLSPFEIQTSRLFFSTFTRSFKGRKLPVSAWNVIVDYTLALLSDEKLTEKPIKKSKKRKKGKSSFTTTIEFKRDFIISRLDTLSISQSKWKEEMKEYFMSFGLRGQLQISNIEESVLIATGLERAIISSMKKVLEDQLFNSSLGYVFNYMISQYKESVPIKVYGNILNNLLLDLRNRNVPLSKQITLSVNDILIAAIEERAIKVNINSIPVQHRRSFFGRTQLRFDGRIISANSILQKTGVTFTFNDTVYPLRKIRTNAEFLITMLSNAKILRRVYANALLRKITSTYIQQLMNFESDTINRIDDLLTQFNREMASQTVTPAHLLPIMKESFPPFPKMTQIPKEFSKSGYHEKCLEIWNIYLPKIQNVLKNLKMGFSKIKSKDLKYKSQAVKLYDNAAKDLKKLRTKLIKSWDKINALLTKDVEQRSKSAVASFNEHINNVVQKLHQWIGDEFNVVRLEPGKLTISETDALKLIRDEITKMLPKDSDSLPLNFQEISLSILLFRRIPEYVVDASYNQLVSKDRKMSLTVRKAWNKSTSRQEFETNLYLNMRFLGNTFINIISTYARTINHLYVKNDVELSWDRQGTFIVLSSLPKEIFSTKAEVLSLFPFDNIRVVSSGKDWEVRYYVGTEYISEINKNRDKLLVFSDVVRLTARKLFDDNSNHILDALKAVTPYLIENGEKNIIDLEETIKEALFKLSEYPTIEAGDSEGYPLIS